MPYQRPRTPIGQRRDRVEIRLAQTTDDGMGGQVAANANKPNRTVAWIWVVPIPLDERRREERVGGQVTAPHAYHFDTAYRSDLHPTMELIWRGKTLQINTIVDDDARRRRLILLCGEVQT